jgi:nucleotide-binding universal stress UspA family protein
MFKDGKVLLATDFSKNAEKLVDSLVKLKDFGIKNVLILQVLENDFGSPEAVEYAKKADKKLLENSRKKAEEIGMNAATTVKEGKPYKEIIETAEKENCQLILLASHGGGVIKEILLGSNTRNIIRKSKVPVFIEKFGNENNNNEIIVDSIQRILLPLDFSESTDQVLEMIIKMSKPSEKIILTSIIESSKNLKELNDKKEQAKRDLNDIQDKLADNNINSRYDIEVRHGDPAQNIIEIAEEKSSDLIVISTKGKGYIRELLIGSTAEKVAENSPIPVLLVPTND